MMTCIVCKLCISAAIITHMRGKHDDDNSHTIVCNAT